MPLIKMAKNENAKKIRSIFPAARLKKIMQSNEDVGKMSVSVPYVASKALEMFINDLVVSTYEESKKKKASRITTEHIRSTVKNNSKFEFLQNVVNSEN